MRPTPFSMDSAIRRYLRVRPVGVKSGVRLGLCYLRAACAAVFDSRNFVTVGFYLQGEDLLTICVDGVKFSVRPNTEDLGVCALAHEPDVASWFLPQPGDLVVDVGAHLGAYALRAARSGARVLAIEPNPDTFGLLVRNVSNNRLVNCVTVFAAVTDGPGTVSIKPEPVFTGRSKIQPEGQAGYKVTSVTLDSLLGELEFDRVNWLIIDAEGAELSVLQGARRTLGVTENIIIEVEHGNEEACSGEIGVGKSFKLIRRSGQMEVDYWFLKRTGHASAGPESQ